MHVHSRASLLHLIKSCGKEKNLSEVRRIHTDIIQRKWIPKDVYISTALISSYAKCGALVEAREIFDQLQVHSVVSWTALICGYAQQGFNEKALKCFREMEDEGIFPDALTYNCLLKACSGVGSLEIGESIENEIRKQGLLDQNHFLGASLVHMYAKCGSLEKAHEVLEKLPERSVVTWNALMAGYSQHGCGEEILKCFKEMKDEGIAPDPVTYICVLKACGIADCLKLGEEIDADVRKQGLLQKDIVLGTTLLDMYAKCGALDKAREIFELLPRQDVVCWNALISGYDRHGLGEDALKCFRQMQDEGIRPNAITYISVLKACGLVGCLEIGKEIDAKFRKQKSLRNNIALGTALVDMYVKCDSVEKARDVFEQLPVQNVVTWNSLIAGYAQKGLVHKTLELYRMMQDKGVTPDAVTFVCILKVCSIVKSLETGKSIHSEIRKRGLLEKDIVLSNTLIDMYIKCGELEEAREVCRQLPERNVASWTILMGGYIELGLGEEAMECFRRMENEGLRPDVVAYICILKSCAVVGSLQTGRGIDDEVRKQGLLQKDSALGNALIDMYAKCGALKRAQEVFEQLPVW
jgi:pentatricopeptide repeat protein